MWLLDLASQVLEEDSNGVQLTIISPKNKSDAEDIRAVRDMKTLKALKGE